MDNPPAVPRRIPSLVAGALPGAALGAAALVTALLRRDKPLHPVGHHGTGHLTVTNPLPGLGIDALSHTGGRPCEARWSRAMGLPEGWPDVEGMALRLPEAGNDGGVADLLFASTGTHSWSRYVLTVRGPRQFGDLTTLLPVRAGGRAVTFRLSPGAEGTDGLPPSTYTLDVALGTGGWDPAGRVEITWSELDTSERFDPITHQLSGIEQYPFVTALREPAYLAARTVTGAGRAARRGRAAAHRAERRASVTTR